MSIFILCQVVQCKTLQQMIDGQGNTNYTGYDRARDLVEEMNYYFQNNIKMTLPVINPGSGSPNNTPVNDINIQYVLKGVYFQQIANSYENEGINQWTINRDYGLNQVEEINIFMLDKYHPVDFPYDGVGACWGGLYCNDALYTPDPTPRTYGKAIKIFSDYYRYLQHGVNTKKFIARVLNHEIGHNLSLYHAWGYLNGQSDECDFDPILGYDETPFNNNCWEQGDPSQTDDGQPTWFTPCIGFGCCDEKHEISNNFMDYNAIQQAVTPCQINRMHNDLDDPYSSTYLNSCNGCNPSNSFFYLPSSVCLKPNIPIELDGRGSWNYSGKMIAIDEVAYVGSTTSLGNVSNSFSFGSIGVIDLKSIYTFQVGKVYRVQLTTTSSCANHTSVKYITIKNPDCTSNPLNPPGEEPKQGNINNLGYGQIQNVNNDFNEINNSDIGISVAPNPASNLVEIAYFSNEKGKYRINIVNLHGQQVISTITNEHFEHTLQLEQLNISELSTGTYIVVLQTPTTVKSQKLVVLK